MDEATALRRADEVRDTVDAILAEQRPAWVRQMIVGGRTGEPSGASRASGQAIINRAGSVLLTTAIGGAIGAVRGDTPTGIVVGLVLGVVLGSPPQRQPSSSSGVQSAPDQPISTSA